MPNFRQIPHNCALVIKCGMSLFQNFRHKEIATDIIFIIFNYIFFQSRAVVSNIEHYHYHYYYLIFHICIIHVFILIFALSSVCCQHHSASIVHLPSSLYNHNKTSISCRSRHNAKVASSFASKTKRWTGCYSPDSAS